VTPATTDNPERLLAELTRTSSSYIKRAWLAVTALTAFLVMYLLLAGWFLLTAYRLTFGSAGGKDAFWEFFIGVSAAFLAVFMLKALFFVKHATTDDTIEITPQDQPRLFEFLHRLADTTGAPRPHRVYLSARVNAAVFYDLSIVNLIFPSRKNLEIGLGLVNTLTVGEFRAVLAHEFGHFAQRAMAVGRWVYIAQQIAAHLVARRDKLDDFLRGLSRVDFRIAWIGWALSLVVWSIRSLVESAFRVVVVMQRALSREMEMQADLVAVSVSGSDALVHALHRLQAADDSWSRAAGFAFNEKAKGLLTKDVFAIQSRVLEKMAHILNDPGYNNVPPLPETNPEQHRIFKAELAQPPRMWLTHPLNHEREANAKRQYISAPIDQGSAWEVFDDAVLLREKVTSKLLGPGEATPVTIEESLQALDRQFGREYLKSRYRGTYLGRSVVRSAASVQELYEANKEFGLQHLVRLYPESLIGDIEQLRNLERELEQLRALQAGILKAPEGVIRYQGRTLRPNQLPHAVKHAERALRDVETRLQKHDRACRTAHLAAAEKLGLGWSDYLRGLLSTVHYADHTEANLRDAHAILCNTVHLETLARRVSAKGLDRILAAANSLHAVLKDVFDSSASISLDASLTARLEKNSWAEFLGELKLPMAAKENIKEWLDVIDSWVNQAGGALGVLRTHALEQLLVSEESVAEHALRGTQPEPAPQASRMPDRYATLLPGQERERQTRPGWWARFQTSDGTLPAVARLVAAGAIVATVLGLGAVVGNANVVMYNGLARPVVVRFDGDTIRLAPNGTATRPAANGRSYRIETMTDDGRPIESFDATVDSDHRHFIYNVAAASPLVEWTAVYGNASQRPESRLGALRWTTSSADVFFEEPPRSVSTKGGGAVRVVLSGLGDAGPAQQLNLLAKPDEQAALVRQHARWDSTSSPHAAYWLYMAKRLPDLSAILAARLQETPSDVLLLRLEQDAVTGTQHDAVCARHRTASAAQPNNPDLAYAAARCLVDGPDKNAAFVSGHKQWPKHGWFAYAAGYVLAESARWDEALPALQDARAISSLKESVSTDIARILRLLRRDDATTMTNLAAASNQLKMLLAVESDARIDAPQIKAYAELARGNVSSAMSLAHSLPDSEARLVRLAAASDGADPMAVAKALVLRPDQGLDIDTLWPAIALAMRSGRDYSIYLTVNLDLQPGHDKKLVAFAEAVRQRKDLQAVEQLLDGLTPQERGYGYAMALILLGKEAPAAWRDAAKRLLFAPERPFFS
jgi:Zn-dependent protease with chaperone function